MMRSDGGKLPARPAFCPKNTVNAALDAEQAHWRREMTLDHVAERIASIHQGTLWLTPSGTDPDEFGLQHPPFATRSHQTPMLLR